MKSLQARFEEKISYTATCWFWTGWLDPKRGYGRFWFNGTNWMVHRMAYLLWVGDIPKGLTIDHLCRVRHCVNPAHLEAVTPRENTLRGEGVTAHNARKSSCVYGHPLTIRTTGRYAGERYCRTCNAEYRRRRSAAFSEKK